MDKHSERGKTDACITTEPLPREAVIWGYRYLLGREPEGDDIINEQAQSHVDWSSFRNSLLDSAEFQALRTVLGNLPPKWVATEIFGGKKFIWLDLQDDFVSRGALFDSYQPIETAVVSAFLRDGDVFLDIGANIGWFTLLASTLVGESGRIHAFEPRRPTVDYLRRSVAMNGLESVVAVHDFGLADVEGEAQLGWTPSSRNPGHSFLVDKDSADLETMAIRLRRLDSLNLERVDLIKMDVEGAEPKILAGARKVIENFRPIILSELYPDQLLATSRISAREYLSALTKFDYKIYLLDESEFGQEIKDFPNFITKELTNFFAVPKEKVAIAIEMLAKAGLDTRLCSSGAEGTASSHWAEAANQQGGVTREQIRAAYVLLLGREPESEQAYAAHAHVTDIFELRDAITNSREYRSYCQAALDAEKRGAVVFIHLEKTGGTTLNTILAANFDAERITPPHFEGLRAFSFLESAKYDFFSAHCDFESVLALPRPSKRIISIFREPRERLLSAYRFWRSHPVTDNLAPYHTHILANELLPEDFFSHVAIRSSSAINNHYLRVFGTSLESPIKLAESGRESDRAALGIAINRVKSLDGVGLTSRMEESVALICHSLGFPAPNSFESVHKTDDFPKHHLGFKKVPPVEITERLAKALEELTSYDEIIYQTAVDEFERRLQAGGKSERPAAGSLKALRRSRR